jgi:ribonucleoside-diphosphate reductase alpha chain
LGVSITGIAQNWKLLSQPGVLDEAGELAKRVNREWAAKIGINPAKRIGCVKPSGNTSALLGTTSGIHADNANYYLRRFFFFYFII